MGKKYYKILEVCGYDLSQDLAFVKNVGVCLSCEPDKVDLEKGILKCLIEDKIVPDEYIHGYAINSTIIPNISPQEYFKNDLKRRRKENLADGYYIKQKDVWVSKKFK